MAAVWSNEQILALAPDARALYYPSGHTLDFEEVDLLVIHPAATAQFDDRVNPHLLGHF